MNSLLPPGIQIKHPDKLYIDGQWLPPTQQDPLRLINPHSEEVAAVVAAAGKEDADKAVAAARSAFDQGPWPRLTPQERAALLTKMADALEKRIPELGQAWTEQVGALAGPAPMVAGLGLHLLRFYAGGADNFPFVEEAQPFDGQGAALIAHEPVGVVATIVPWNAPFTIMINKISPALLAGCCVIMKPAPESPLEAYIIAEAAEEAGLPPGVLNLLPAERETSDHLIHNPGIDKVSFTGSTLAGKRIAEVCGARIGRCSLELGGKSAAVISEDFDVQTAARILAETIVLASGQVCATLSRVIVPKSLEADYAEALKVELEKVVVGDPKDPASQMGPLSIGRQLQRVENYIQRGRDEGAQLVCGGNRPSHLNSGYYINPTLFSKVDSRMVIAQEEIFGPVLSLLSYENDEEAIRIANDSDYGLFGAVFCHDVDRAYRIARGVRTGALSHNAFKLDYFLPFGGFKQSGIGREGGIAGLKSYTETKTILLTDKPSSL